jgi:hypothetical protein
MIGYRKTLILGVALLASAFVVGCSARAESRRDDGQYSRRDDGYRRRSNRSHERHHSYGDHPRYRESFSVGFGSGSY